MHSDESVRFFAHLEWWIRERSRISGYGFYAVRAEISCF